MFWRVAYSTLSSGACKSARIVNNSKQYNGNLYNNYNNNNNRKSSSNNIKGFNNNTLIFQSLQRHAQNIRNETKITQEHLTPELRLHLITPECRLFYQPLAETPAPTIFADDPFWAFYWPGGQALSRYILDNPALVANKTLLDVGSGCGASALAALKCNAKYVVANDIDEVAGCAALMNAKLNEVPLERLHINVENLIDSTSDAERPEDIILIGDLFYDEEFAVNLLPWLQRMHNAGKRILVGDPGRHGLTANRLSFMRKLAKYELTPNCCIENSGFKFVNVWAFH